MPDIDTADHHVTSVKNIDWSEFEIGDTLNIDIQTLNDFDDYRIINNAEHVSYNNDTGIITIDNNDNSEITSQVVIMSKYALDLAQDIYFGTTINTNGNSSSGSLPFLGTTGYVQLLTQPHFNRTNSSINYANFGTDENAWYTSMD